MVHGIGIAMLVALAVVSGHGVASAAAEPPCLPGEPDSVQISWDAPCESDAWLMDTELGCRMWDWHPDKGDKPSWTGACRNGLKEGRGNAQWFEDGQAIDRFAGTYHLDRRQGFGLYVWNDENWYEGNYDNDRPNGAGIAHVAGEVFSGQWKDGCLKKGDRVVAIGVQRSSCADPGNPKLSNAASR
jgi:hypothetical protein